MVAQHWRRNLDIMIDPSSYSIQANNKHAVPPMPVIRIVLWLAVRPTPSNFLLADFNEL
jgi:hypothetical protein